MDTKKLKEIKDGQTVWVKTEVLYQDKYCDLEYPILGLESVTIWDLNLKKNREGIRFEKPE